MKAGSSSLFWIELFGSLALEASLIALLASGLQRFAPTGTWRRTIWQIALLALGAAVILDLTGGSQTAAGWARTQLASKKPAPQLVNAASGKFEPRLDPVLIEGAVSVTAPSPSAVIFTKHKDQFAWWPGLFWLAGFCFMLGRTVLSHLLFVIFRQRRQVAVDADVLSQVQTLARLLGIRRRIRVTHIPRLAGPIAFGILRPTISLPEEFSNQFTVEQRAAMLIHELAHLAARDAFWYLLADMVTALLWWHPVALWARRQFQMASETAADEASLLLQNGPDALAESLVAIGRRLTQPKSFGWIGVEGNGFRSSLGRRVEWLVGLKGGVWQPSSRLAGGFAKIAGPAILVFAAIICVGWALPHQAGPAAVTIAHSWKRSVVGLALESIQSVAPPLGATSDEHPPEDLVSHDAIPALIEDAKRFLEADKLAQAEGLLDAVLKAEPDNAPALSYWHLVQEKRKMKEGQILPKNRSSPARLSEFPDVSSTNRDRLNKTSADGEGAALGILPSARANSRMAPNALDETRVSEEIQREPLLHTRSFKVDPNTLVQGLQETAGSNPGGTNRFGGDSARLLGKTHDAEAVAASLRQFFKAAGVDLSPPKSLFFNHRLGLLMVRANLQDLDTIEQAIQMLNTSPPQLTIEVKFCEVTQDDNRALGFDWLLDNTGLRNSAPALLTYTGILTDPQFRVVIRALEQRQGVDLLSARKITTLSGRQAQIKTVDVKYIVTNLAVLASNRAQSATGGVSTIVQPMMEPVELGPVLDVVPHVSADGYTIQMTVIGTIKEFLGYDLEGHQPAWAADSPHAPPYPNNTPKETTTPRPTFRVRQVVTTAVVYDGQTLVLEGGSFKESELHKDSVPVLGDLPLVGRLFRNESSVSKRKKLLIFVTPTLIDPAGNRLHSEEEMALRKKGVPPQPAAGEKAQ